MKKILVIDDETSTLSMSKLLLGVYGYTVFTAENEATGLEIFKQEKPPIVMTDIKMPGADGFSVLQKIKAIDSRTEVIVITGHGDKDLAKRAFALNASAFLHKPLQIAELEAALKDAEEKLGLKG